MDIRVPGGSCVFVQMAPSPIGHLIASRGENVNLRDCSNKLPS